SCHDLLDDLRDPLLHYLGACAFVLGTDGQGGKLDVGQQIDTHLVQRNQAQNHHHQGDHGGQDGPLNTQLGKPHGPTSALPVDAPFIASCCSLRGRWPRGGTTMGAASSSCCCPSVTT